MIVPVPHDPRPGAPGRPLTMAPASAGNRYAAALWQASEFARFAAQMDGLGYTARADAMRRMEGNLRAVAAEFTTEATP